MPREAVASRQSTGSHRAEPRGTSAQVPGVADEETGLAQRAVPLWAVAGPGHRPAPEPEQHGPRGISLSRVR